MWGSGGNLWLSSLIDDLLDSVHTCQRKLFIDWRKTHVKKIRESIILWRLSPLNVPGSTYLVFLYSQQCHGATVRANGGRNIMTLTLSAHTWSQQSWRWQTPLQFRLSKSNGPFWLYSQAQCYCCCFYHHCRCISSLWLHYCYCSSFCTTVLLERMMTAWRGECCIRDWVLDEIKNKTKTSYAYCVLTE